MSHLEKLTLSTTCDHLCPNLSASLTHLCIALSKELEGDWLARVADELTRRLTRIQSLELHSYFDNLPPGEFAAMSALSGGASQQGQLHGLRLTRLRFHPGEIARFLSRVGEDLSTLALQQVPEPLADLLPLCPRLEQLDVEQHWELDGLASVLPTSPMTALTFLRVEVEVKDTDLSLIRDRLALLPRLSMLDLYVRVSASLRADYDLSVLRAAFDDLLQACEERHICLLVNARPVATFGGFRTAAATRYNTRDAVEFHI